MSVAACGGDDTSDPIDAAPIDAPLDAAATVPSACMHVCVALACGGTPDGACVGDCQGDLTDCTQAQVEQVDACSRVACAGTSSAPIRNCLAPITCLM